MNLCAPSKKQDKGISAKKDFQIIRKSTLTPLRMMVRKFLIVIETLENFSVTRVLSSVRSSQKKPGQNGKENCWLQKSNTDSEREVSDLLVR